MTKSGKCMRRKESQKAMIEKTLAGEPMTIAGLARALSLSHDTIRNRINEMVVEGRPIRVADWMVLETTMVRVWGYGSGRDEPRPVPGARRGGEAKRERVGRFRQHGAVSPVRFRREGMDEWLFRIRELR